MSYTAQVSRQLFLRDVDSIVSGYKRMDHPPVSGTTATKTASVTTGTDVAIEEWISPAIGAADWSAADGTTSSIYCHVSSSGGVTKVTAEFYRRTYAGDESLLGSCQTVEIDATSATAYTLTPEFSASSGAVTDRLVVKLVATTTSASAITVTVTYLGITTQSRINIPFYAIYADGGGDMTTRLYDPDMSGVIGSSSTTASGEILLDDNGAIITDENNDFVYEVT